MTTISATAEAVQADLEGIAGVVLVELVDGSPPAQLLDWQIRGVRIFAAANPGAPVFRYRRDDRAKRWTLEAAA